MKLFGQDLTIHHVMRGMVTVITARESEIAEELNQRAKPEIGRVI